MPNKQIANYEIVEKLYESSNSIVYRANRIPDNFPVILKVLNREYPTSIELARFRREYEITRSLKLEGIIECYDLQKYNNTLVMVIEDFGGESLDRLLQTSKRELSDFLYLAIQVVSILRDVHHQHIIHKDINPSNIVWNRKTNQVKLIDFGISTELSLENAIHPNNTMLEGSLPYISPEQTGRMNRSIDYRTDFYSLGITFYEMLTGRLPFNTDDPLEMVYFHIVRIPIPSHEINPKVFPILSDIVMKLLSKAAEDRYKCAIGILHDLQVCFDHFTQQGCIPSFTLGEKDVAHIFNIPEKLYGRQKDIETLLETFHRVTMGSKEVLLITGGPGIGKSSVINEIQKPVMQHNGYFVSGKYDQFKQNIPYSAIIEAMQLLIRQILSESKDSIAQLHRALLDAVGNSGQILINVIPEIELIIGKQPELAQLDTEQYKNRFNMILQNFVHVLGNREKTLVIFLDDMQWIDIPSLKLIEVFITDVHTKNLFIIGSYRDNEITFSHPLSVAIEEWKKQLITVQTIVLQPLVIEDVKQLVADTFNLPSEASIPLAELCIEKTHGNPFFLNQLLHSFYENKWVHFDHQINQWVWDITILKKVNITDNVVDLMVCKIQKLPKETRDILKIAACIGNQFDLNTLAIVCEKPAFEIAKLLFESLKQRILVPMDYSYKLIFDVNHDLNPAYRFLHDRIHESAYSLIEASQLKHVHLTIGRLLLTHIPNDKHDEHLFDILNHMNVGLDLIQDPVERKRIAELYLRGVLKAKNAGAYELAYEYAANGIQLISEKGWENTYTLMLSLHEEGAESAYLNRDYDNSERMLGVISQKCKKLMDRINAEDILLLIRIAKGQLKQCLEQGIHLLKLLGIKFKLNPNMADVIAHVIKTKLVLMTTSDDYFLGLPDMRQPKELAKLKIITRIGSSAFLVNQELFPILMVTGLQLMSKFGNDPRCFGIYSAVSVLFASLGDIDTGYRLGTLAESLLARSKKQSEKTRTILIKNMFIQHLKHHLRNSLNPLTEAYHSRIETGDIESAAYAMMAYNLNLYCVGTNLEDSAKEQLRSIEITQSLKQKVSTDNITILHHATQQLITPNPNITSFSNNKSNDDQLIAMLQEEANLLYHENLPCPKSTPRLLHRS
ncbi:MAG: serine/threonine-protein kinase PknK, partial [Desulfobacterales bacterium]|nr:serine/threonine-protein kinase PknK [Desulfobacterales bacterium]